jgi:hypothetical protein
MMLVVSLAACGEDAPRRTDPVADQPAESLGRPDEIRVAAEIRPIDAPLAVGAVAPRFEGFPEKRKAVIVFFRGRW